MPPPTADAATLAGQAHEGDPRALARLVSLIEDGSPRTRALMREIAPRAGGARVIGLTGPPGAGKSTVTSALVRAYRGQGHRVAVLAIDPSSPFTGGALLGDRIRMQEHATDPGVFIRSMASRGQLGGLAVATPQVIRVLDAARFGLILIETVGVGQIEVDIASTADSVVVLVVPGMGDAVQAAKAGILEIADVFAVNKADRPQAQEAIRDLRAMIALADRGPQDWKPPIVATVATAGDGIDELVARLDAHWSWLESSGERERRRAARARAEVAALALGMLRRTITRLPGETALDPLAAQVARGEIDPYTAADTLLLALGDQWARPATAR
ncbi:MAG TPA: methylmalonyl Co-A mutase-associated GTPase MeaB [Streptosporangiaceae bacterium]